MKNRRRKNMDKGIRFKITKAVPLLIIPVLVNETGPFNFVVDTGASMTVVTPCVASQLGLNKSHKQVKATGAGGQLDVSFARVKSLRLGTLEVANLRVAIISLDNISQAAPVDLHLGGIIGYNLLRRYRVTIDYPKRRLFIELPDGST